MSEETEQAPTATEQAPADDAPTAAEEVPAVQAETTDPNSEATVAECMEAPVDPPEEIEGPPKKSVTFNSDLTFDEANAEISAIRSRAEQTRASLRTSTTPPKSSYTSSSTSNKSYSYESEPPKSKNMLSHLNSPSAMLNYKVQTARSLVRKQEDLLRNLARMRENMERSENELGKASDFYISGKYLPRKYDSYKAVSTVRSQVQPTEPTPVTPLPHVEAEIAYSPPPVASVSSFSYSSKPLPATTSSGDYQPDEDFEREMAALRKRVSDITKKATEVTTKKYSPYYDYDYLCSDSPSLSSNLHDYDIYKSEQNYEKTMSEAEVQ